MNPSSHHGAGDEIVSSPASSTAHSVAPAHPPAVSVRGLRKSYGGVVAVDGMDVTIEGGTIHAVVGENGAGKSTLMKILAGVVRPDAGTVEVDGEPVVLESPGAARLRGIGLVYQELNLFPHRSVLANLFVNAEPTSRGLISHRRMVAAATPVLARVGLNIDLDQPVGNFTVGERQLVELSRVLLEQPRLLILDEPNSALNERETTRLFGVLRDLVRTGITILYVSHRLEEVFAIASRITVVRNGRAVLTRDRAALTMPEVVQAMVGGAAEELFPPRRATINSADAESIVARDLVVEDELRGISFTARRGEIVGLAGLEGSGVTTLLGVLFGTRRAHSGEVRYPDGRALPRTTTEAARRGISLVPADRRHQGLMLDASVARNIGHVAVGAMPSRRPWLRRSELVAAARRQIEDLRIRARSPLASVNQLSGGNQQKVVVGKWLEVAPRVVLLDDPTRGVDVGAKREIYLLIRRLAAEGHIVLFRSTELPELIGLADRILVLYRGRLAGEAPAETLDGAALLHAINTGELRREN